MDRHSLYTFLSLMALNGTTCHKFIYSPDKRVFGENTMAARTIISVEKPQTQTVEAVKALLSWRGRAADPLPSFVELGKEESRLVLVLSNKKDAYYTTTARACSCPAHNWHSGQRCKHQRKYFAEQQTAKPATVKQPNAGRWHGRNGPIIEDGERPFAKAPASPSFELVDCLPDASNREIAYWSIQEDKALWPAEA